MRILGGFVLSFLLSLAALAEPSLAKKFDQAEDYLKEVEDHLARSFIERERVDPAKLVAACRRGIAKAADDPALKDVGAGFREALLAIAQDERNASIASLLKKVEKAAKTAGIEDLDVIRIADLGAQAMVQEIQDPFSSLLKGEDLEKLIKQMQGQGRDDSIGIGLEPAEGGGMQISFVMYGYAAYDAGLKVGDRILEVDGKALETSNPKEIGKQFALKTNESLVLTIRRAGWKKPYDIQVTNTPRKIKNVWSTMLPGGIGYVRLTIFDLNLGGATMDALKSLKKQGMKALVLDLRNNPGGALPACVSVADHFIGGKKLITYTESNLDMGKAMPFPIPGLGDQKPEMEYYATRKTDFEDLPMVVLVNGSSASASEMLSGALQDLGRAVLVGEKTFGKGIGQTAIPLWKTQGSDFGKSFMPMLPNRFLYLTVMRYFLPSGRSIHHEGIVPEVLVTLPVPDADTWDEVYKLRKSRKAKEFAEGLDEELAKELAVYDGFDTSSYPGWAKFRKSLKTKLTADQIREEVRREVRLRVGGNAALVDMQTDTQLQRGITILAEKIGFEPEGAK